MTTYYSLICVIVGIVLLSAAGGFALAQNVIYREIRRQIAQTKSEIDRWSPVIETAKKTGYCEGYYDCARGVMKPWYAKEIATATLDDYRQNVIDITKYKPKG